MASPHTVLLVDDDAAVRESMGHLLGSLGFCVLAGQNGHEAMRRLAQIQVDVLLADIVMPDLNGIELAKRAKLFQREIKVVFMTGYYSRAAEAESLGKLLFKSRALGSFVVLTFSRSSRALARQSSAST